MLSLMIILVFVLLLVIAVYFMLRANHFRILYLDLRKLFPGNFSPKQVSAYYDEWHDEYRKYYGNVIQAWRPASEEELNKYLFNAVGIKDGMKVLDAGCGFGAFSLYAAQNASAKVDGVTVSSKQQAYANDRQQTTFLKGKTNFICADYNEFISKAAENTYDRIVFLESFGYAQYPDQLAKNIFKAINKGGEVFIKDFFKLELPDNPVDRRTHIIAVQNMDKVYLYNTPDLYHTIYIFRKSGFELTLVKKPDFVFDDYQVVNNFQDNNNIDLYEKRNKLFIVEPFELKFRKPLM